MTAPARLVQVHLSSTPAFMRGRAMTAPARLSPRAAAGIVLALRAPYAALNAAFPGPRLTYALGLLIAALALGALRVRLGVGRGAWGVEEG
jgi:hypothetical protein